MIFGISVLIARLAVVTGLAKCLPVGIAPHKRLVTTMWNDVIDHCCCDKSTLGKTLHAQRVFAEVRLADALPLAAVATLGGRWSVGMQWLVLLAVLTLSQIRTAGVTAWAFTLPRHSRHLLRV